MISTHLASLLAPPLLSEWKKHSGKLTEPPALPLFQEFIEEQINASADPSDMKIDEDLPVTRKKPPSKAPSRSALYARKTSECRMCKNDHSVFVCPQFSEMSVPDRRHWAEAGGVCFNSLDPSHRVDQCGSTYTCKRCQQKHHTLLHLPSSLSPDEPPSACVVSQMACVVSHVNFNYAVPFTAIVRVKAEGLVQQCRAHLDTGASVSLISLNFAKKLKAKRIPNSSTFVKGINYTIKTLYQVKLSLLGSPTLGYGRQEISIMAHVVDSIPSSSSQADLSDIVSMPFVKGLSLADPHYVSNSHMDMLLEIGVFIACGRRQHRYSDSSNLEARLTIFRWTVGGTHSNLHSPALSLSPSDSCLRASLATDDPERLLRRFWEVETFDKDLSTLSSENEQATSHFSNTCQRDSSGRYHVSLPR